MKTIRIATRKSPLALAQAHSVITLIRSRYPELDISLLPLTSMGDEDSRPLQQFSEVGVFVKTLEKALLNKEADCALHCLKDLPAPISDALVLPCILPREEVNDVLICRKQQWEGLDDSEVLSQINRVATGSSRRRVFLGEHYPHWNFLDLRGNINTRIKTLLDRSEIGGIVLAQVGIRRLYDYYQKTDFTDEDLVAGKEFLKYFDCLRLIALSPDILPPPPGQGSLALQCCSENSEMISFLRTLSHPLSERISTLEREVMVGVEGGCHTPLGVWGRMVTPGIISLTAAMEKDGKIFFSSGECLWKDEEDEVTLSGLSALADRVTDGLLKPGKGKKASKGFTHP